VPFAIDDITALNLTATGLTRNHLRGKACFQGIPRQARDDGRTKAKEIAKKCLLCEKDAILKSTDNNNNNNYVYFTDTGKK
jgi:hypothetical protein